MVVVAEGGDGLAGLTHGCNAACRRQERLNTLDRFVGWWRIIEGIEHRTEGGYDLVNLGLVRELEPLQGLSRLFVEGAHAFAEHVDQRVAGLGLHAVDEAYK
jgi:hypothetical protein